jgi:phosphatidylglycerophosphate synthase
LTENFSRRPIATRSSGWAQALARRLAASAVTPNQISIASVGFAVIAGLAFWASAHVGFVSRALLLVLGAAGCQARLICNLLDGMVAIEGGKRAPDGPFWNEAPDRAADIVILAGLGLAAGWPALGWAAAAFAVLTAYLRELGRAEGMAADFGGPLAKPQRMAVVTVSAVIAAAEPFVTGTAFVLQAALWFLMAGTVLTAKLRGWRLIRWLRSTGR